MNPTDMGAFAMGGRRTRRFEFVDSRPMTPVVPISLSSEGLLLRCFQTSDPPLLLEAVTESGTDLSRYETWAKPGFTLDDATEYVNWWITGWQDATAFFFAVALDGGLLGACGLFSIDLTVRTASLGYWIRSSQTGRGYASAAAQAVVRVGFEQLGLDRVDMLTAVTNTGSLRVGEKIGAVQVAVIPDGLILYGASHDAISLSVNNDVR